MDGSHSQPNRGRPDEHRPLPTEDEPARDDEDERQRDEAFPSHIDRDWSPLGQQCEDEEHRHAERHVPRRIRAHRRDGRRGYDGNAGGHSRQHIPPQPGRQRTLHALGPLHQTVCRQTRGISTSGRRHRSPPRARRARQPQRPSAYREHSNETSNPPPDSGGYRSHYPCNASSLLARLSRIPRKG